MKKTMKLSKILLLIVTVFSYVASPIAVLADEIISMPLNVQLKAMDEDKDGYVDNYELTYISQNNDYDVEKEYKIELETTFTYNDETTETKTEEFLVDGKTLNEQRSSYVLDPISKYYDGTYSLDVTVYDDESAVYEDNYVYNYSTLKGLTGRLNEVMPTTEEVDGTTTIGNYDVTLEGEYTQSLSILTGELSPNGKYRIVYSEELYSDVMTGEALRNEVLAGNAIDLTGKLAGTYSYTATVTIEEVKETEILEYEVVNTYTYNYNANLKYGTDNDELFSNLYGVTFEDGYMIVNAKGLYNTENVITLNELVDVLAGTTMTLEALNEERKVLDLNDEEVLAGEVRNNYVVSFTNGATASYVVVVKGDATSDNQFTSDDLAGVMEGYLNEDNMPSMDMVTLEEVVEDSEESVKEAFGTITFEDVMFTNELLKENGDTEKEVEDNSELTLVFGELPEEVFVGDTIELGVVINSGNVEDYIDGIDGLVTISDNLKLVGISSDDTFNGIYNSETGRLVGAGAELASGQLVMTLVFNVVGDGTATIEFSGKTAKYLNISDFEAITKEIEITRNVSTNNNLSSLNASVGTFDIEFDKDVTVYTLTVPYDTESVILSGGLEDILSEVDGLIEYELTEDKAIAVINVTAEDGTVKTYTVYIVKESAPIVSQPVVYYYSSNNYLKSLEVDGQEIEFDKYTNEYKITVKNDVTSLDIKALAEDTGARVEITGNEGFEEGENIVTITVTAENGTTREYKLIVTKEEKKQVVTDIDDSSNTAEKIVIIVLIILVVLGLLYLIFKKDDEEEVQTTVKKEIPRNNSSNKNTNNSKNNNKNKKK